MMVSILTMAAAVSGGIVASGAGVESQSSDRGLRLSHAGLCCRRGRDAMNVAGKSSLEHIELLM